MSNALAPAELQLLNGHGESGIFGSQQIAFFEGAVSEPMCLAYALIGFSGLRQRGIITRTILVMLILEGRPPIPGLGGPAVRLFDLIGRLLLAPLRLCQPPIGFISLCKRRITLRASLVMLIL